MKKLLTLLSLVVSYGLFAQYQFRIAGEYGFPLQKDFLSSSDAGGLTHVQKGSFGNGVILNLGIGKVIGSNTSLLLDVNYATSREFTDFNYSPDGRIKFTRVMRGNYWAVTPNLLIKSSGMKLNPYVRFGLIAAMPWVREQREYTDDPEGNNIYRYKGNLALGFLGSMGFEFFSSDGATLFLELVSRNLVYHPAELENTENYQGLPLEPSRKFSTSPSGTDLPAVSRQFSSIGLSFGLRINIFSGPAVGDY